jgi:hypothetical protein
VHFFQVAQTGPAAPRSACAAWPKPAGKQPNHPETPPTEGFAIHLCE